MLRAIFFIVLLIAVNQFSACSSTDRPTEESAKAIAEENFRREWKNRYDATLAELECARELWSASGLINYDFQIGYDDGRGGSFSPALIKVRGSYGSSEKVPAGHSGEIYKPEKIEKIDRLFDLIKDELDKVRIVETVYDRKFGYPEKIRITAWNAVDVTETFYLSNFERRFENDHFENEWKSKYERTLSELNRNRLIWQENKIVDYDFVCEQFAGGTYGFYKVFVKVRDGQNFVLATPEKIVPGMGRTDDFGKMGTFETMFDFIREELEKYRIITVKYNKLGYPQHVDIIYSYRTHGSKSVLISKFEVLK